MEVTMSVVREDLMWRKARRWKCAFLQTADNVACYIGYMASLVTWPIHLPYSISYWCPIGTNPLSSTNFEIFGLWNTHIHTRRKWFYILSHAMYCIGQTIYNSVLTRRVANQLTEICHKHNLIIVSKHEHIWHDRLCVLQRQVMTQRRPQM